MRRNDGRSVKHDQYNVTHLLENVLHRYLKSFQKQFIMSKCVFRLCCPHLHLVSHLNEGTRGVESSGSTGVQMGAIVVVYNLHIVHTV